ncbi:phosphoribosylglycinamide formyltransferase [Poronia punctata]|nr:phosphoribosylglycinamide formyltransferase [Poronia punctata]
MNKLEDAPCRILVMASGFGSNFQALIDAICTDKLPNCRIISLVTNRKNAHATVRADKAGIPWDYFNLYSNGYLQRGETDEQKIAQGRKKYDADLAKRVLSTEGGKPELVILAGWMHVFSQAFLGPLEAAGVRIINIHPALPGEFDGAMAIERAFAQFKTGTLHRTGIMAHYVIDEVDRGAPIVTEEVKWNGEDLDDFKELMHRHEHRLIVKATKIVVSEIKNKN